MLSVENLHTHFFTYRGTVKAVNGVHFSVKRAEVVGIIGETGSGKSMTAKSILGIVRPPGKIIAGKIIFQGMNLRELPEDQLKSLRGKELSLIVQNPKESLNPMVACGDQIAAVAMTHLGLGKQDAFQKAIDMMDRVEIRDSRRWAKSFPHQLSGGMAQRICIAMALVSNPQFLIADEPTSNLDLTIQKQILDLIKTFSNVNGMAVMLITHDVGIVANYCHRVSVLYAGQVVESCTVEQFLNDAQHPYSRALLKAIPEMGEGKTGEFIAGAVPNMIDLPSGCHFHPRCRHAVQQCRMEEPPEARLTDGRSVKCHLIKP